MRILGLDPGVENFAWALHIDGIPVSSGWVVGHDVTENDLLFINCIVEILHTTKPDVVVMERYMFRGGQSVIAEPANIMIGKVCLLCRIKNIPILLITAAQWKIKLKIKDLKRGAKDLFPDVVFPSIHQADAMGIAKYHHDRISTIEKAPKPKVQKPSNRKEKP